MDVRSDRRRWGAAAWLALLLLILGGAAQADDAYRVGADDVLSITVLRHPELSVAQVVVTPDGGIQAPVAGSARVAGSTLRQIADILTQALKSRLVDPEVSVSLVTPRVQRVFVLGAVARPGVYELRPGWRVTEALASAGGLTARPEAVGGALFRAGGESVTLELTALLADGNLPVNLPLQAGDVLSLTDRTLRVSVTGQVQQPGLYDVPMGAGVVEALAMAGGAAPGAALSRVTVQRASGAVVTADLFRTMVLGEIQHNLKLEAGDLVMVPQSKARVAVLGAVNRPGYYDIEEGLTLRVTDAIALAGGAVKRARLGEVGLVRTEEGRATRFVVDLGRVLRGGETARDLPVRGGDLIFVPEARLDWDLALRALTSVSILRGAL